MTLKWGGIKKKENKQTNRSVEKKKYPQATSAGMVNRGKHVTLATLIMVIEWKLPPTNERIWRTNDEKQMMRKRHEENDR